MVSALRCAIHARYSSASQDDRRQQETAEVQVVHGAFTRDQLPGRYDRNAK
ncbi:hypothetical protein [uncultured Brevundimonas sp.]|uniref:hypothetical protein n=1 Tax=uncultured Brevundimonas sp. TaxID=213418 RepID=UPI0025CFD0BD|nr:hypothetical protein [uncultured Brevundimonas sp.]